MATGEGVRFIRGLYAPKTARPARHRIEDANKKIKKGVKGGALRLSPLWSLVIGQKKTKKYTLGVDRVDKI